MSWFRVTPDKSGAVTIGRYKEQLVREVAFPLPELGEGGHYLAKLQRPHDEAPYPLASRVEGRTLIWLVGLEDTSDPGEGLVEIRWDGPNGETWKSPQYAVRIAKGLADPKEAPEAWAGFLQQVNRDAGRAESAADRAEALEAGYTEALEKARAAAEDAWQGKVSAETSAKRAETAASTATQAAQAAQTAQGAAGQAAQAAQTAKEAAEQAQTGAETAKTEAQAAKTAAEEAAKAAQGAASTAQTAANTAQGAAAAAENAQQSVETLASQVQGDADKVAADKAEAQKAAVDALGSQQEAQRQATAAQEAATSAGAAATSAAESKGQAETARTGAEAAQTKAEEAAQGVAADREQIGANKSGLEAAQQELTATKEQLAETKATLATTNEDLKKAQRAIQFQSELNKGQTWDFEEDAQAAYQRQVPSGAKAGAVMAVGGKTVVWNQLCDALPNPGTYKGVKVSVSNGKVSLSGTATDAVLVGVGYAAATVSGHKYMATGLQGGSKSTFYVQGVNENNGYYNILDSTAIFAATGAKYRYNIIAVAGTVFAHTFQPMVVDLTLMFGSGNEPTDTTDPRIAKIEAYAAAHPEYNAGELVSALVDEVRVAGKNVAAPVSAFLKSGVTMSVDKDGVYHFSGTATAVVGATSKKFTLPGGTYTVSVEAALPANVYVSISSIPKLMVGPNTVKTGNWEGGAAYVYLYIGKGVVMDNVSIAFQVERGTTHTAYVPYQQPSTYPIPSAVQALPGYGWSAGSVANTVERTENGWQYVQRVGSVDLGTLDWRDGGTGTSARRMVTRQPPDNAKIPKESSETPNAVCPKYEPVTPDDTWLCRKEGISLNKGNANVIVYDSAFATAESLAAFKAHVTGVPIYYELSTPITTDITALMGDSLAPFPVEAGGSITLHHPKADEGFAINVPAKIQYITKLSEVSANG